VTQLTQAVARERMVYRPCRRLPGAEETDAMRKSGWFPVTVVAFVLAGTSPALAQDMPDAATRERVADWIDQCNARLGNLKAYAGELGIYADVSIRELVTVLELRLSEERNPPVAEAIREFGETCLPVAQTLWEARLPCGRLAASIQGTGNRTGDIARNPERYLNPGSGLDESQRRSVEQYLQMCVPAYAEALDSSHRDDALASGSQETPRRDPVAASAGSGPLHGSIAFSQEDGGAYAWGIAWSYDSSAGAESEAIGQCREYGGTQCAEAGWFQEACGALAIGSGNGYGTGWGATTAAAERDALAQCRAVNDDCRIEVARCSRSEEAGGAGRMDGAMPDQEDSVATISTEPKCEDVPDYFACWYELEAPDGCFVYWSNNYRRVEEYQGVPTRIFWSGSCSRGVATGEGTLEIFINDGTRPGYSTTGTLGNSGLRQGRWIETDHVNFISVSNAEGHYVDGKRDGRWTLVHEGALRTAESYYVEGEQTSVWTDGVVELGAGWWPELHFGVPQPHD